MEPCSKKQLRIGQKLWEALLDDRIDVIATDHSSAYILMKKNNKYKEAPSGGPLVQHTVLPAILEKYHEGIISLEKNCRKRCAITQPNYFKLRKRGFIKEGFFADLTIVNIDAPWTVSKRYNFL